MPPEPTHQGQIAWITGASRGLGAAIARALAARDAAVVLTARDAAACERIAASLRADGATAIAAPGSVADPESVASIAARIDEELGALHVLVNNAAITPMMGRTEEIPLDEWDRVLDVNLRGALLCSRVAAPRIAASGGGAILNISSVHAISGGDRIAAYAASKGALEALTRATAVEWADRGVRVNALAPGYLETDMTAALRESERWRTRLLARIPAGRFGTVDEIAACAAFLTSPDAAYVTGATLHADGGWTAR
jgi:NAD(P)-dependent dehydrogenase (short-subunit alcohol dehydrogenase family)